MQLSPPSPSHINSLKPHQVVVFGSNSVGHHGGGAAGYFFRGNPQPIYHDLRGQVGDYCVGGIANGFQQGRLGASYAIVTKDAHYQSNGKVKIGGQRSIPLKQIEAQIIEFLEFARSHSDKEFLVTEFGTRMAGYTAQAIGALWVGKEIPSNVCLPQVFIDAIRQVDPSIQASAAISNQQDDSQGILISPFSQDLNGLGAALSHDTDAAYQQGVLKSQYPIQVHPIKRFNCPRTYLSVAVRDRHEGNYRNMDFSPTPQNKAIVQQALTLRFIQHPRLLEAVKKQGGVDWLNQCQFRSQASSDTKDQYDWKQWDGIGKDSPYLQCLSVAYEKALEHQFASNQVVQHKAIER